jgi:uncharacterized protein YjdB
MFRRDCFKVLGLVCLVLPFTGCNNTQVASITVAPATQSLTVGQSVQFTATGMIGHGNHPPTATNVTDQVTWTSSTPAVATVSSSGMATAVGGGSTIITATLGGTNAATATLTVTSQTIGTTGGTLVSLAIIPGSQSVASPSQTSQFLAIGTTTTGATEDVTGQVTWSSSSTQVATITAGGLATGLSQGTTTITAIAVNADGSIVTGTASFTVQGGASEPITALTITPSSQSVSASGQTGQFIALGTSGSTGLQNDVTSSPKIQWISNIPSIASISSGGLVTGVSAGSSAITAIWTNPDNSVVSASAAVTVTLTAAPEPLLSLTIIPSAITVGNLQDTGNFLAIGTFSTSPTVRDLTNSVTWLSSEPDVFPVDTNNTGTSNPGDPGGIVTAYGNGSAVIIAEATDPTTGSIQTATATFNCPLVLPDPNSDPPTPGSCFPGSQAPGLKVTLTVYNEGLNQTNWLITAPSATGTADVLHCGPGWAGDGHTGGSVCTAAYPLGTTVTLTAPAQTGVAFGGWSWSCAPVVPINATGPNSCTVILGDVNSSNPQNASNVTVGAIFN